MGLLVNVLAGLLFGLGLLISGMADPAKVQNFLDVFGTWDPSLAFVMAGAVATALVGYRFAFGRAGAAAVAAIRAAGEREPIDRRLMLGAGLFGVGWGLTGFCPGPAVVSIPLLAPGTMALRSSHARRHCARPLPAPAAVRAGVSLPPMHDKCSAAVQSTDYRTRDISRKSNIDIAISSLPNLSHPA